MESLTTLQQLLKEQRECIERINAILERPRKKDTNEQHDNRPSSDRA
jgi:hypothetical protein